MAKPTLAIINKTPKIFGRDFDLMMSNPKHLLAWLDNLSTVPLI